MYNSLQYNNIITQSQSGFIPGDSTVNQPLRIYNDLCTSFDTGITTQSVYLDISEAIHRVWHKALISKLAAIGITGKFANDISLSLAPNDPDLRVETLNCDLVKINEWADKKKKKKKRKLNSMKEKPSK